MRTQRETEVPATWRDAMGIHPDCERAQPGHTRGLIWFYIVDAVCAALLIYGIAKGF
jgi:hypothetical protein